jgi:signal transduction histidine kinase
MLRRLFDLLYEKLLSRLGLALLALALLVNLGALLAVNEGIGALDHARASAEHSRGVMADILRVQSTMYEDESAQRGFLYTQRVDYLAPLNDNVGKITTTLTKLHDLVADDPTQQKSVDQVLALVTTRINLQNKTIAAQQMGDTKAAFALVNSDQGETLMAEIDKEVSRFLVREEKLRQERTQKGVEILLAIRWGFAIILFINAMMILVGAVTITRSLAREIVRDRKDVVQHDEREAAEQVRHDERKAVAATEFVQRAGELRALSAHLLRVQEEERRNIARELHDELGGTLSAIKLDIIMGRDAAVKHSDVKSVARFQRALAAVDSAVKFVRHLIEDLRPTLLDNLGLEAALRALTTQFSERLGCECVISLPKGELNLTAAQSTTVYRVCQEALTNVMKYANAKRVTISLTSDGVQWKLLFTDDGVGLDATKQYRAMSHGLLGMRERIVALAGTFDIRGPAGLGTTLDATFPVAGPE